MFVMYVSLCGLSPVGCNRYNYSENELKAAEHSSEPKAQPWLHESRNIWLQLNKFDSYGTVR